MLKFFKKYHKWLGIIASLFLLVFSISGIILNHRSFFSPIDVDRKWMPKEYQYQNWNNAAVRSAIDISPDSVLIYGNIGVWLSDSTLKSFSDFSKGFSKGIDNKKICKIFKDSKGRILAGSLFGLYQLDINTHEWHKIPLPPSIHNPRIVDIVEKGNEIWLLTRSEIIKTTDLKQFSVLVLPPPENYDHKIGLFKTLWVIHSGEIYGFVGKILVDIIGLIFIFLTLTGLFYFFNKERLKRGRVKQVQNLQKRNRFYLKWHNKIGWISVVFLIIITITGMFLRPPLLIAITEAKVSKIPYSHLDTPNPWFDRLRRIYFDETKNRLIVVAVDGVYYSDDNLSSDLKLFSSQPPLSVMGVNAFEAVGENQFLVGSFVGLFLWNSETGEVYDYIEKKPYIKPKTQGPPIGDHVIAGYFKNQSGKDFIFDFGQGLLDQKLMAKMSEKVLKAAPISLWNTAIEYHTGRIYSIFIGNFYILIVPIIGLMNLFIMISGFIVWWKRYRNKSLSVNQTDYLP